jgi:hypothetical protein
MFSSFWTILFFATDETQDPTEPFFNDTWAAVSAFSAFLINMRVGLGWALTDTRKPTSSMTIHELDTQSQPQFARITQLSDTEVGTTSRLARGEDKENTFSLDKEGSMV